MHKYLKLLDKKLVSREAGGQLKKKKIQTHHSSYEKPHILI
jgi:hypothetical protein